MSRHRGLLALVLIPGVVAGTLLAGARQPAGHPAEPPAAKPAWPPFERPSQEMKDQAWLCGTWDVAITYFGPDGRADPSQTEATIGPVLGGCFLQEQISIPALQLHMTGIRSFDRFRGVYRLVWLDDIMSLADVFEGTMQGEDLTVSNLKAGTSSIMPGAPETFVRFTQHAGPSHDRFTLVWEASADVGATWKKTAEYAYTRRP